MDISALISLVMQFVPVIIQIVIVVSIIRAVLVALAPVVVVKAGKI